MTLSTGFALTTATPYWPRILVTGHWSRYLTASPCRLVCDCEGTRYPFYVSLHTRSVECSNGQPPAKPSRTPSSSIVLLYRDLNPILSPSTTNVLPYWCIVPHDHSLNAGLAEIQPSSQHPCSLRATTRVYSSPHPHFIGAHAVACLTVFDSQQSRVDHQDPLAFSRRPRLGNRHHIYARYQRHEALTSVTRYPWAW